MQKKYDLCVATGKYKGNDGQEKTRWATVGAVWANDKGFFMTLNAHFNPAGISRKEGSDSIVISMFPPKANNQQQPQQSQQAPAQQAALNPQSFDPEKDFFPDIPF